MPNRLPIAKTAGAASTQALPVTRAIARTTAVRAAPKRGPRGSMPDGVMGSAPERGGNGVEGLLGAQRPGDPADHLTVRVEHQHGRGAQDAQPAGEVETLG